MGDSVQAHEVRVVTTPEPLSVEQAVAELADVVRIVAQRLAQVGYAPEMRAMEVRLDHVIESMLLRFAGHGG